MTEQKSNEVCKKCKWKDVKFNRNTGKAERWCIEAGCFISLLTKCPL